MNKEEETFSRGRLLLDLPNGEGKKIIYVTYNSRHSILFLVMVGVLSNKLGKIIKIAFSRNITVKKAKHLLVLAKKGWSVFVPISYRF